MAIVHLPSLALRLPFYGAQVSSLRILKPLRRTALGRRMSKETVRTTATKTLLTCISVLRRFADRVNHQHFDRPFGGFQLEAGILQGDEDGWFIRCSALFREQLRTSNQWSDVRLDAEQRLAIDLQIDLPLGYGMVACDMNVPPLPLQAIGIREA